jgi:lipopolysaccharide/colanic/teichoic acid biosynthesis glycosyltransferase
MRTRHPHTDAQASLSAPVSESPPPYHGKRTFDLLAAGVGCMVFAPVAAAITVATLLGDGGPVLFIQQRVGSRRQPFEILKFRSMREQRVTRVGQWLRLTGLDELPQFLNVCRGDMSVIGPRPLTVATFNV